MKVQKFTNNILSSNSYIIYTDDQRGVWVIDPGDSGPVIDWIYLNHKKLLGILLTHSHIDHIYGVNHILKEFPDTDIYASKYAHVGLYSAKANGSHYMERPYVVDCKNFHVVGNNSEICLLISSERAIILNTPGHNNDCISFDIGKYLFTGDALIPGVKVHIKSKQADKFEALESINRIINRFTDDKIICPGHGDMTLLGNINVKDSFSSNICIKS